MTPEEISKAIAETFDGAEAARGKYLAHELAHWYIECWKLPALKLGLGETWADRTKYALAYGIPLAILFLATAY
jgi:hypothetical protein